MCQRVPSGPLPGWAAQQLSATAVLTVHADPLCMQIRSWKKDSSKPAKPGLQHLGRMCERALMGVVPVPMLHCFLHGLQGM